MPILSAIQEHKIIAIIRGAGTEAVLKIAEALCDGGVRLIEVTMNSPNALQSIEALRKEMGDRIWVGAGTVLDATTAKKAVAVGAGFIISPTFDRDTIRQTKDLGAVSIPGAFTPTEIFNAFSAGGDIIKVFPGALGVEYIKAIRAPLPQIPLMPTGGVTASNISHFLKAGAVAFGIGTALADAGKELTEDYLEEVKGNARRFVDLLIC